jgi:amidase
MPEMTWLDATAQADLVRRGEVSPKELAEAAIARIEAVNPQLDAVIRTRFDAARLEADDDLPDGAFRGVPILFKDLGCTVAGEPTAFGVGPMREVAWPVTSYLAEQFHAAGFVALGRTNVPELGTTVTTEPRSFPRHATRGIRVTRPEARRPRWRLAWCRSRTPTTAAVPSGSRRASAVWSG